MSWSYQGEDYQLYKAVDLIEYHVNDQPETDEMNYAIVLL